MTPLLQCSAFDIESTNFTAISRAETPHKLKPNHKPKAIEATITRLAKFSILQMQKKEREMKLAEKFRRFDLRQRKGVRAK